MLRDPGKRIGDTWYYVEENICHCFYLTCPDTQPRHQCWDIAHATSRDLIHWTKHGVVLPKGQAGEWDCSCLSTGSVIRFDTRYWMAYSNGTGRSSKSVWRSQMICTHGKSAIGIRSASRMASCMPSAAAGYVRFAIGVTRFFLSMAEKYI